MDFTEIKNRITEIKKEYKLLTNCYSFGFIESIEYFWNYGLSFACIYLDHGIHRLIYFAANEEDLAELIRSVPRGKCYLEFLTNDIYTFSQILSGETIVNRMQRLANNDCSSVLNDQMIMKYEDDSVGVFPSVTEAHEVNEVLWKVFSEENGHLLFDSEIETAIQERQISIHRNDDGEIDAILKLIIKPKRFYINHVYNGGPKKNIHSMMISRIKEYISAGGRYMYSWVADNNIASLKWHEKYGLVHDGVWDMIYRLER